MPFSEIQNEVKAKDSKASKQRLQFAAYKNTKLFMEPNEPVTGGDLGNIGDRQIISATVKGTVLTNLTQPVQFKIPNPQVSERKKKEKSGLNIFSHLFAE